MKSSKDKWNSDIIMPLFSVFEWDEGEISDDILSEGLQIFEDQDKFTILN